MAELIDVFSNTDEDVSVFLKENTVSYIHRGSFKLVEMGSFTLKTYSEEEGVTSPGMATITL